MLGNLASTAMKTFAKVIAFILAFFLFFNVYLLTTHLQRAEKMAQSIQTIVRINGFIPPDDVDTIKAMIEDHYVMGSSGNNGRNIFNSFITDFDVVMIDYKVSDGRLVEGSKSTLSNNYSDFINASNGNKRRNFGGIKKVGVTFSYHWFNPIYAYSVISHNQLGETADGQTQNIGVENMNNGSGTNTNTTSMTDIDTQIKKNTTKIDIQFIDTVITEHTYSDLDFE